MCVVKLVHVSESVKRRRARSQHNERPALITCSDYYIACPQITSCVRHKRGGRTPASAHTAAADTLTYLPRALAQHIDIHHHIFTPWLSRRSDGHMRCAPSSSCPGRAPSISTHDGLAAPGCDDDGHRTERDRSSGEVAARDALERKDASVDQALNLLHVAVEVRLGLGDKVDLAA